MKKKIAILSAYYWPVEPLYYPYNMAKILKNAGHEVSILTVDSYLDGRKINRPLIDYFEGIKIIRSKKISGLGKFAKLWFPAMNESYDIVHCCGGYRHPFSFWGFLKRKNAKYILSPFYPMQERKSILQNFIAYIIDKTIGKLLIQKSDYCFAETDSEKKWLENLGAKKIEIIPNPIPDDFFKETNGNLKQKLKIKNKMIFCLANHVEIKNFEDLIKAMQNIDATLLIGGEQTEYTKKCQTLAKELGVQNRIIWQGYMNYEEKKNAFASCDIFVLPSKRESLGTVLLEAMAQKKPVISTNKGGIPDVVPDDFCLYEPGDVETLINKINEVLINKPLSTKLAKKGYIKAKNYSYDKVSKKYLDIIHKI